LDKAGEEARSIFPSIIETRTSERGPSAACGLAVLSRKRPKGSEGEDPMAENQHEKSAAGKVLVLLVGPQGSGKTTWCHENLPSYLRISQDEMGQKMHFLLYQEAIERGEPFVVVDRINAQKFQRKRYLDLAKKHGYRTRIVWLNADRNLCLRRCRERTDHPTLPPEDAEKALALYFSTFQVPSRREADVLDIIGP